MEHFSPLLHRTRKHLQEHGGRLAFILAVAWTANYLHFTSFGLYGDDWFFQAYPFLISPRDWIVNGLLPALWKMDVVGRPLQQIFTFSFGAIGGLAKSLSVDYLIAFALFASSAGLMYELLRRRFSNMLATIAALLFVLTPLHTLHQFLNGQFTVGPAFIFLFLAMLLYLRGKLVWSYVLAVCSLFLLRNRIFSVSGRAPLAETKCFRG
jgi:hypothetical protein